MSAEVEMTEQLSIHSLRQEILRKQADFESPDEMQFEQTGRRFERAVKQLVLHIRWQGGACSDAQVDLPPNIADRIRYPADLVERIRTLAETLTDTQIAQQLNQEGRVSPKGNVFSTAMIQWVRYKHAIPAPKLKHPNELTVNDVMVKFGVSRHVVYYWIERGHVAARQIKPGTPYWITLDIDSENALSEWVRHSSRLPGNRKPEAAL